MHEIRLPIPGEDLVSPLAVERDGNRAAIASTAPRRNRHIGPANRPARRESRAKRSKIVEKLLRRRRDEMRRGNGNSRSLAAHTALRRSCVAGKYDAECLQRPRRPVGKLLDAAGDRAGIQAAAQSAADRHVAAQMNRDRFHQRLAKLTRRLGRVVQSSAQSARDAKTPWAATSTPLARSIDCQQFPRQAARSPAKNVRPSLLVARSQIVAHRRRRFGSQRRGPAARRIA